jgi:tetratricopeptide (TPR) repeat protein
MMLKEALERDFQLNDSASMNRKQRRRASKLGQIPSHPAVKTETVVVPPGDANLLGVGLKHHQAGRLAEAEACYRRVLAAQPDHADALHLLGVVAHQAGRDGLAVELISQAIKQNGQNAAYFCNLGIALNNQGKLDEAVAANRQALRIKPDLAEAHCNLGNALRGQGKLDEALATYDRALTLWPDHAEVLHNRGNVLQKLKRFDEALASYDRAVSVRPDHAKALNNRGLTLHELKRFDEALASYDRVLTLRPDYAEAHYNRGLTLHELKRFDEALASYDRALSLRPDYAEALNNCGNVLQKLKRFEEALASYDRVLTLRRDYAEAHYNRGIALRELKRPEDALASYDKAIALKPDYADGFTNRALCRLLVGRYIEGWNDYEWRWDATDWPSKRPNFADFANWHGEDLKGRRLLVFSEQGLGDIIQFARYLPLLARNRGQITFLTAAKLTRLLRPLTSGIEVISTLRTERKFDFQCALMSLPHRFGTDLASIPNSVPYLRAEDAVIARWRERIGAHGFKIGIAWQGNPQVPIDRGRSIPLTQYFALARLPGVRLISLQKQHGLDQLGELPDDVTIETLGGDFDNGPDAFVDTAAVMENLDLIITSDTSIAHLAGALGRSTWVALMYVPDWRWLLDREDSPWYPTMRLFRQPERDNWQPVFANMERELRSLLNERKGETNAAHTLASPPNPTVQVSWGEFIDKMTILEIKEARLTSSDAVANVRRELTTLRAVQDIHAKNPQLAHLTKELKAINEALWEIENQIRAKEAAKSFDQGFVDLARSVYFQNDKRGKVKRQIDILMNSEIVEEKQYTSHGSAE